MLSPPTPVSYLTLSNQMGQQLYERVCKAIHILQQLPEATLLQMLAELDLQRAQQQANPSATRRPLLRCNAFWKSLPPEIKADSIHGHVTMLIGHPAEHAGNLAYALPRTSQDKRKFSTPDMIKVSLVRMALICICYSLERVLAECYALAHHEMAHVWQIARGTGHHGVYLEIDAMAHEYAAFQWFMHQPLWSASDINPTRFERLLMNHPDPALANKQAKFKAAAERYYSQLNNLQEDQLEMFPFSNRDWEEIRHPNFKKYGTERLKAAVL